MVKICNRKLAKNKGSLRKNQRNLETKSLIMTESPYQTGWREMRVTYKEFQQSISFVLLLWRRQAGYIVPISQVWKLRLREAKELAWNQIDSEFATETLTQDFSLQSRCSFHITRRFTHPQGQFFPTLGSHKNVEVSAISYSVLLLT